MLFPKKWITGENINSILPYIRKINKMGINGIINFLGEELYDEKSVEKSVDEYLKLTKIIKENNLKACISVKLTQLGLLINKKYCIENLKKICESSEFTWIDMENYKNKNLTIEIYLKMIKKFSCGIAIQSYLKDSEQDLRKIIKNNGIIRLVKGAYRESSRVAYKNKNEIDENYLKLMRTLFEKSKNFFSIATHDHKLILEAIKLNKYFKSNFEFAMLKGIRNKLKLVLVKKGFRVSEYVPYGKNWFPYFSRRIKEKPSNILLIPISFI